MSNSQCSRLFLRLIAPAVIGFSSGDLHAVVLDWSNVTWAAGSLTNSYDIDPSTPGNDVTVTVSGNTSKLISDPSTGVQTPAIDTTRTGGTSPPQRTLDLAASFLPANTITLTVSFSAQYLLGVQNVAFSIFGIDRSATIQSITGLGVDGTTLYAPIISNLGSAVTTSGTGINQVLQGNGSAVPNNGPGSADGNATIDFGTNAVQSVTFTFRTGQVQIGVTNISFTPVPEMNPAVLSICSCAIAGMFILQRRCRTEGVRLRKSPR